ncbi:MAG: hypothetical protein UR89_C0050G0001 [Candidatus Roizmanbacteria bacterium GW2011_GWA2_35_8]|uniref:Uncharacterized protein n=1 Tax=Candidatus Roizmanbacteria bacterium GW2011_GWA2_35_8 TaxID=1618479 RepID=A0A0G0CUS9_9BACT|nr:MAG: hypothetical protein UR89_C0050G0001 [Candidatus Roizmanbacteria bacterium GW2011_GWA2_35_8]
MLDLVGVPIEAGAVPAQLTQNAEAAPAPVVEANLQMPTAKEAPKPTPTLEQGINTASEIIIRQQAEAFGAKWNTADSDEQQKLMEVPANRVLKALHIARNANQKIIDAQKVGEKGFAIQGDKDLKDVIIPFTLENDQVSNIHTIVGVDRDNFIVTYTLPPGTTPQEQTFPVSRQYVEAFLMKMLAKNPSVLPEAQKKIVELYFQLSENNITADTLPPEAGGQLIEAARSAGIPRIDDFEVFLKVAKPDTPIPADADEAKIDQINKENEKIGKDREKIIKPLKDRGVLVTDAKLVADLFTEVGGGVSQLKTVQDEVRKQVARLTTQLETKDGELVTITIEGKPQKVEMTEKLRRQFQIDQLKAENLRNICDEVIKSYEEGGPLQSAFEKLNAGTLSQEDGKALVESIRTGQIAKPPDIETAVDERDRIRLKKLHDLYKKQDMIKNSKKMLLGTGGVMGALLAFAMLFTKKE